MDRGIATEENLAWLAARKYKYLAVSREARRRFDAAEAQALHTASGGAVRVCKRLSEDGEEARLYCHSAAREKKERAIEARRMEKLEAALRRLHAGLSKPRARRKLAEVQQRAGRLLERSNGAARHCKVEVQADEGGEKAKEVRWERCPRPGTRLTHPGVCCLRSNVTDWEPERMWQQYARLTDVEAVFRCLKSELGMRPIYHRKAARSEGEVARVW